MHINPAPTFFPPIILLLTLHSTYLRLASMNTLPANQVQLQTALTFSKILKVKGGFLLSSLTQQGALSMQKHETCIHCPRASRFSFSTVQACRLESTITPIYGPPAAHNPSRELTAGSGLRTVYSAYFHRKSNHNEKMKTIFTDLAHLVHAHAKYQTKKSSLLTVKCTALQRAPAFGTFHP